MALMFLLSFQTATSQSVPAEEENIPFMVTFGDDAPQSWGDDDYCQIFFFVVPASLNSPFYLRIFDPDCGGKYDENREEFNTKTRFTIYGGNACYSNKDARNTNPMGNYRSGNLLSTKDFDDKPKYDDQWFAFGPFNPAEGEFIKDFDGYIFKIIAEGIEGNDGNLYRYFFSTSKDKNIEIEGGNTFTYEYTFRLSDDKNHVSHIYPFVDDKVVSIKIHNFDWDNDGYIRLISNSKNKKIVDKSGNGFWTESTFSIQEEEKNTTFDIQFVKTGDKIMKNNNGVLYVTNQYNEFLPFFTTPIGGIPKYKYKITISR
ncbi:MAG: hypothetical protein ABIJ16_06620 [Bacteroidota bacterium]